MVLAPSPDAALALADAVLGDERVRLAEAIREDGEHAVRRAIELAALVLSRDASASERAGAGD